MHTLGIVVFQDVKTAVCVHGIQAAEMEMACLQTL